MNEKKGKLLYHLTDFTNLESIIKNGLLPRYNLMNNKSLNFEDVADQEIIDFRRHVELDKYVPFHFFVKNPFDGKVQKNYPLVNFIYICITRNLAKKNNFNIIPQHPKSMTVFQLYDYDEGFDIIDWDTLESRDYSNHYCKNVCMAECVGKYRIKPNHFHSIVVKNEDTKKQVKSLLNKYNITDVYININPEWFL